MEKKNPRKYTEEFKRQAVQLAIELGSPSRAAKQLGVPEANVHNWKWKQNKENTISTMPLNSTGNAQVADAEELKRLRRENAELKKVNHILKAAAAVFSRDHLI